MQLIDFIIHIDVHLAQIISDYGVWTYLILFLIIFCETGLVITPLLPGDSLLFVAGAFASVGSLNIFILLPLIIGAAMVGDTVNYWIGRYAGPKIFRENQSGFFRFLKKSYLVETEAFYEKHGGKTIIIGRFMPIIRTFAPFVAGIGKMNYKTFLFYNVTGALAWVGLFIVGGYFFGMIPVVKENLTLVIFGIITLSLVPGVVHYIRKRIRRSR